MHESCRWLSSAEVDVDAYLLMDGSWFLFAYVKEERLVDDSAFWNDLQKRFPAHVALISRALKTEDCSKPLRSVLNGQLVDDTELDREFWCKEGWARFRLEGAEVLNPGLFLDQRYNRQKLMERISVWIEQSKGTFSDQDGLLNLFSYTGSFSIAALCAGLKRTTSVDVSSRYLEWERKNFEANFGGLDLAHRLIRDDARDFLKREQKRGSRYRWIVLDPPTFSKGQKKSFRVQEDLAPTAEAALECLVPGGALLVSTNDARWELKAFYSEFEKIARSKKFQFERGAYPTELGPNYPLKSAWILTS